MENSLSIYGINGPLVTVKGKTDLKMSEMVYVGKEKLVGEVIRLSPELATIQVFEETSGLKPGELLYPTGATLSVTLAPGIVSNIFDGIERPLAEIEKKSGKYIDRGFSMDSLDTHRKWQTKLCVKPGDRVSGGTIIAEVPETPAIVHKVMVPPDVEGIVETVVPDGEYTINDTIVTLLLKDDSVKELTMTQKWPIRIPRPNQQTTSGIPPACNRTAYPGYPVPYRKGRHSGDPRRFRYR